MNRIFAGRFAAVLLLLVSTGTSGRAQSAASVEHDRVPLTVGRSTVLATPFDVVRLAVTDPAIADATVVAPREVLIDGKGPGTVSLILWGAGQRKQYDIIVEPGVSVLQQQMKQLFPLEDINVGFSQEAIILSGKVSNNSVMLRAGEIAQATSTKLKVINLLELPGGMESQQVLLQVRVAEVNQRALKELGASFFTSGNGFHHTWGRIGTQQFAAPDFDELTSTKVGRRGCLAVRRTELQRLPEPVLPECQVRPRRRHPRAQEHRSFPDARRTEPDRLQRPGSQLPCRRRDSDSGRPGGDRDGVDHLQGVRGAAEVHPDDCRRRHSAQSAPRSQHAWILRTASRSADSGYLH